MIKFEHTETYGWGNSYSWYEKSIELLGKI